MLAGFISYTNNKGICALCCEAKNSQYHHQPVITTDPSYYRRASYSVEFQITGCDHVFHQACLMNWLEEGIAGDVKRNGRVKKVPAEMRSMLPAAGCTVCCTMQELVEMAGLTAPGLEAVIHVVQLKGLKG
jgi:hypothetical protein